MFKILVKVVIPHLYKYEVSLTSKHIFKSLGKICYRSLSIGIGMSEQILKTEVRLFRGSSISHSIPVFNSKSDDSQISKSQICIIHFFSMTLLHRSLLSVFKSNHGKVYQQAVSCSRKDVYWGDMGSQP